MRITNSIWGTLNSNTILGEKLIIFQLHDTSINFFSNFLGLALSVLALTK